MSIGLPVDHRLQVVQHVVRADVRENLADPGEEEDVEVRLREPVADRRGDVQLRVEHPLEHLAEVGLVLIRLGSKDPLPDPPLLEQLDRQVVEVDLEDRRPQRSASRFLIRFLAAAIASASSGG